MKLELKLNNVEQPVETYKRYRKRKSKKRYTFKQRLKAEFGNRKKYETHSYMDWDHPVYLGEVSMSYEPIQVAAQESNNGNNEHEIYSRVYGNKRLGSKITHYRKLQRPDGRDVPCWIYETYNRQGNLVKKVYEIHKTAEKQSMYSGESYTEKYHAKLFHTVVPKKDGSEYYSSLDLVARCWS